MLKFSDIENWTIVRGPGEAERAAGVVGLVGAKADGTMVLPDGSSPVSGGWVNPSKLIAHYDAQSSLSSASVGSTIGRWPDESGSGNHLLQSTAANRPTRQTAENGLPCVRFDGTNDVLQCITLGSAYPNTANIAQPYAIFVAYAASASVASFAVIAGGNGASATGRTLVFTDKTVYMAAGASSNQPGEVVADGVWRTCGAVFGRSSYLLSQNGYPVIIGAAALGTDALGNFTAGGLAAGNYFTGDIGEIVVVQGDLSLSEIDSINSYLTRKWTSATVGTVSGIGGYEQTTSPNGQAVRIWNPETVGDTAVIMCHKHGANEQYAPPNADFSLLAAAQSAGYVVAASFMHGDTWGNATAQADVLDVWAMLKARHASLTKLVIIGYSMGGLASMSIALGGSIPELKGVFLVDAASSLSAMFAGNAGTYSASIRTAYGIAADGSDYAAKTAGFDPMLISVTAPALSRRYAFMSSPNDTNVVQASNTTAMVARLAGAVEVTSRGHTGTHLAGVAMRSREFVDFVRRCAT